jgi:hypothetical protein
MLDEIRANPRQVLEEVLEQRRNQDATFQPPPLLRFVQWAFLDNPRAAAWGRTALKVLGVGK